MTQEIKTYYNLNEAIKNYQLKYEPTPKRWWMFVSYRGRIYYDASNYNPKENKIAKETMITNIRNEAEIIDRDQNFKIIC